MMSIFKPLKKDRNTQNGNLIWLASRSELIALRIEFQVFGSDNILPVNFAFNIDISLDIWQRIWDSTGYLLVGIAFAILSFIYLKKILTKRNISTFLVN